MLVLVGAVVTVFLAVLGFMQPRDALGYTTSAILWLLAVLELLYAVLMARGRT